MLCVSDKLDGMAGELVSMVNVQRQGTASSRHCGPLIVFHCNLYRLYRVMDGMVSQAKPNLFYSGSNPHTGWLRLVSHSQTIGDIMARLFSFQRESGYIRLGWEWLVTNDV